jgi:hypothetical protein
MTYSLSSYSYSGDQFPVLESRCSLPHPEQLQFISYLSFYLSKIHLNIIILSPKWALHMRLQPNLVCVFLASQCMLHLILLTHSAHTGWRVQIWKLYVMNFLHSFVISSLLGTNIFLNTLFWDIFYICSFLGSSEFYPLLWQGICGFSNYYVLKEVVSLYCL